jgi:hypothetical protein
MPRATVRHAAPKYADPKTGATWSGRGIAPLWIRDVKNRSRFLIDAGAPKNGEGTKPGPAKKAKVKRAVAHTTAPGKRASSAAKGVSGARARKTTKATAPEKKAMATDQAAA